MKLLDRLAQVARRRRLADATVDAYTSWVRSYLAYCADRHGSWVPPEHLHTVDVEAFLNHLVLEKRLSASSQNQALNALVFLYRYVLENVIPQDHMGKFVLLRSQRRKRVPTVLSVSEVTLLLQAIAAPKYRLMAKLLYGTGLRVAECCTLRVRDIDLGRGQIIVREGKGDKDRVVMLPESIVAEMAEHLAQVEKKWRFDVSHGGGYAPVPGVLEHKRPAAGTEWAFQFVFPSAVLRRDEEGLGRRWHADGSALDREVKRATAIAGIHKRVTCHTFRHSFATHLLEAGYDIRQVHAARSCVAEDRDDLHARHEPPGPRGDQPAGSTGDGVTWGDDRGRARSCAKSRKRSYGKRDRIRILLSRFSGGLGDFSRWSCAIVRQKAHG